VGMMSVVTDMGTDMEYEREPTWEEAAAEFDAAEPVELARSPRAITVVYRYADRIFTATSPDVRGFRITGRSLHETRDLVRQDLERFLDAVVEVRERFPAATPEISTATVGRGWLKAVSLPGIIVTSSSSTAGAFVSSVLASHRRARSAS